MKALLEIHKYQKSFNLLILKAPFTRLVKEIMHDIKGLKIRIQVITLLTLQEFMEALLVIELECKCFISIILNFVLI
jgi:histone H3/H4